MQEQGNQLAEANSSTVPHLESVDRISKIPIVQSAWGVAAGLYGKVKESSGVVNWTLNHAEAVSTAALAPVASRLGTPIHVVDSMLCKGIAVVEEIVPAIKLPPQEMLDTTREHVVAGLGLNAPGPEAPATARIIGAGVGAVAAGLGSALSLVEWYVDKYVPVQPGEDEGGDKTAVVPAKEGCVGGGAQDVREVVQRLSRLNSRLIRVASAQIKVLKQQREDARNYVGKVAHYITSVVTDPKALVSKAEAAWAEMTRRLQVEEDEQKYPLPRVMARKVARRVVGALDLARVAVVNVPTVVRSTFNSTARYGMCIIGGFLGGSSKNGCTDSSNGQNSEERAKLLCMRQEKGTSPPPPLPPTVQPAKTAVPTADKDSSTEEKQRAAVVPTKEQLGESIAVAN